MTAEGGRDNLAILALANVPLLSCDRMRKPRGGSKRRPSPWYITTGESKTAQVATRRGRLLHSLLGSLSSGSALQIANGDQVAVSNRSDVGVAQAHESLRLSGGEDKLHFESIGTMNIDYRTEIAATKTMLGKVSIQDDSVEQVEHDYPG